MKLCTPAFLIALFLFFKDAFALQTENGLSIEQLDDATGLSQEDFKNAQLLRKDQLYKSGRSGISEINRHRSDIRQNDIELRRQKRNGVALRSKVWPNGRIPYAISPKYNLYERALLARAVKTYHSLTCIRFEPKRPSDDDYLFIGKVDGCFSDVGRTGDLQVLSLDDGCMEYPTIIHEMMHVIGFYHEHERWDRDKFIDIIWQNIDKEALDQFGRVDLTKTSYYGQPYDYDSILHYDSLAFSKNGYPTLIPKQRSLANSIGHAVQFSKVDLAKINSMYGCYGGNNRHYIWPLSRAKLSKSESPKAKHKQPEPERPFLKTFSPYTVLV